MACAPFEIKTNTNLSLLSSQFSDRVLNCLSFGKKNDDQHIFVLEYIKKHSSKRLGATDSPEL